ncbi:uncharacterized protein V6R79_001402 [Siganus canaliculatus]
MDENTDQAHFHTRCQSLCEAGKAEREASIKQTRQQQWKGRSGRMGTAARHITRSSNEGARTLIAPHPPPPSPRTPLPATTEREAGINCEGDDGERAEEQVITARLLLERRGQSVERHATCTIPMIPQEGGEGGEGRVGGGCR